MEIIIKGSMQDETSIQIEDWSKDYSFMPYGSMIGAYPISKQTLKGNFSPELGRAFRFQLDFESHEEAQKAFDNLVNGNSKLIDYQDNFSGKQEELICI